MRYHYKEMGSPDEAFPDLEAVCGACGTPLTVEWAEDGGEAWCSNHFCPQIPCDPCFGSGIGYDDGEREIPCPECRGTGAIQP